MFGVFSVNEELVVFQYIFAIFNSLQVTTTIVAPRSLCILSLICAFEADSVNTAVALCGYGATFVTQGPKIPSLVFWLF